MDSPVERTKPCAYVAQGKGGLLKVGHTKNAAKRLVLLKREFKKKGDELVRFEPCAPTHGAWTVERLLIDFCRKRYQRHSGFEWFIDAPFDEVKAAAEVESAIRANYAPPRQVTDEERARWRAEGQRLQARRDAAAAALRERLALWRHRAQFSARHRAKRVFAAIAVSCGA